MRTDVAIRMRRTMAIDVRTATNIIKVIRTATARRWWISWKMKMNKSQIYIYRELSVWGLQLMMIPTLANTRMYGSCSPMMGEMASFPIHPASSKEDNNFSIIFNKEIIISKYTRKLSTQLDPVFLYAWISNKYQRSEIYLLQKRSL